MKKVTKAVIPATDLGTRVLPATKALPKEMLTIVDKPSLQYIVEELVEPGITDIVIVTGRNKNSIEDHFDFSYELENTLKNDYFQTGYLNEEEIKKILLDDMKERKKIDEKIKENENLSFNKLYGNWWKLEDEEVNDNFRLLKEELKGNKYPPTLYKDIIIILLQLEKENFIDENEILEFIELMKKNLELDETKKKYEKSYKYGIFEIFIENSKAKEKYNNSIKDLLYTIDKNIQKQNEESFLVENKWNEEFLSECSKRSNNFLINKKFIFYENIEELMKKIVEVKSPYNIYCLIEGIRRIYSFSNVNEYYKNDIPNLELLINKLKFQIEETQKYSKTRTIVLKELHNKLEDYLKKIKK